MNDAFSDELISAYLDGELTAEQQSQVEQLLLDSREHRQMFEELRALRSSLQSLPTYKLDDGFAERVMKRAELANAQQTGEVPSEPAIVPMHPGSWRVAVLAVASVAAALFVSIYFLPRNDGIENLSFAPADMTVAEPAASQSEGGNPNQDQGAAGQPEEALDAFADDAMEMDLDEAGQRYRFEADSSVGPASAVESSAVDAPVADFAPFGDRTAGAKLAGDQEAGGTPSVSAVERRGARQIQSAREGAIVDMDSPSPTAGEARRGAAGGRADLNRAIAPAERKIAASEEPERESAKRETPIGQILGGVRLGRDAAEPQRAGDLIADEEEQASSSAGKSQAGQVPLYKRVRELITGNVSRAESSDEAADLERFVVLLDIPGPTVRRQQFDQALSKYGIEVDSSTDSQARRDTRTPSLTRSSQLSDTYFRENDPAKSSAGLDVVIVEADRAQINAAFDDLSRAGYVVATVHREGALGRGFDNQAVSTTPAPPDEKQPIAKKGQAEKLDRLESSDPAAAAQSESQLQSIDMGVVSDEREADAETRRSNALSELNLKEGPSQVSRPAPTSPEVAPARSALENARTQSGAFRGRPSEAFKQEQPVQAGQKNTATQRGPGRNAYGSDEKTGFGVRVPTFQGKGSADDSKSKDELIRQSVQSATRRSPSHSDMSASAASDRAAAPRQRSAAESAQVVGGTARPDSLSAVIPVAPQDASAPNERVRVVFVIRALTPQSAAQPVGGRSAQP